LKTHHIADSNIKKNATVLLQMKRLLPYLVWQGSSPCLCKCILITSKLPIYVGILLMKLYILVLVIWFKRNLRVSYIILVLLIDMLSYLLVLNVLGSIMPMVNELVPL
jgi:hypothetical protein